MFPAMLIGLIADTHGQLHSGVARAFRAVDRILHAGDVGSAGVLAQLRALAPVTAIHGNADPPALQHAWPAHRLVRVAGTRILLVHYAQARTGWTTETTALLAMLRPHVVVFGHSHRQYVATHDGVLFVNPGGGGRRRFRLRRSVALLSLGRGRPRARIVWLDRS
jgi:hypothetical protein